VRVRGLTTVLPFLAVSVPGNVRLRPLCLLIAVEEGGIAFLCSQAAQPC
jgi:hypothetical protein